MRVRYCWKKYLMSSLLKSLPEPVKKARNFAIAAHASKPYRNPYVQRLDTLANFVWGENQQLIQMAYLCKTLEEQVSSPAALQAAFGSEIADAIVLFSDEQGENRIEVAKKTLKRFSQMGPEYDDIFVLKIAERALLMRDACASFSERRSTPLEKEYPNFYKVLHPKCPDVIFWDDIGHYLNNEFMWT